MITVTPPRFRRHPRPLRRRPAATPVAPLNVLAVSTDDPPQSGRAHWLFDGPATLTGAPPVGLRVFVAGNWLQPIGAIQAGPEEIWAIYETAETLDGAPYSIVTPPAGIAQAAGIVLPQEGTIVAP